MLEEKTYTISELAAVLGGATDRQSIKHKLERKGISYTICGRGKKAIFTITEIPNPFQMFCIIKLGFAPQTDFYKVRNLFYYCFNDEEFFAKPNEEKEILLRGEGKPISRQSISNYLEKLNMANLWSRSTADFVYYFADGNNYRVADKEEYLMAWHDYWAMKEYGYELSYVCDHIKIKYGGFPRKQGYYEKNALEYRMIAELIELTNQSFDKEFSDIN